MEFSEQSQRLADTTYRNIEELMVDMKGLMAAANTLHKAMTAVSGASDEFSFILQSIGAKATRLPGAVSKLGECLTEMVSGHRTIRKQYSNWVDSLQTDLIFPLEEKLERDTKIYTKEHKQFKQETSKKESKTDKTASKLKSMQKRKISREVMEKENELRQMLADRREDLHATRVQALRNALIEERKIYCFLVERLCSVTHSQITYNAVSHQEMSTKVMGWTGQCSHPNELPPESASLLRNPRSPNAFHPSTTDVSDVHYDGFTADTPDTQEVTTADIRRYKMQASPSLQLNKGSHQNCRVRAIYPHQSSTPEKLQFNTGDLIDAVDDTKQGWLYGTHTTTGQAGWFPAQYVSKIWPTPEPQRRRQGVVAAGNQPQGTPQARPSPLTIAQVPERDYKPASSPTHQTPYNPPLPSPSPPPAAAAAANNSDSEEEGQSGFAGLIAAAARKKSVQQ